MSQQDTIPVKNLTLGLAAGFGAIAAVIVTVLILSQLGLEEHDESTAEMISERIKPLGRVRIEGEAAVGSETVAQESTKPSAKPTPEDTSTATPPPTESVASSSEPSRIDLAQGEETYNAACALCHASGIAGAPILGNKEAWAPRVAKGMETLFTSALQGLGAMPPKGGQQALPNEDIKSAVGYMVYQVAPAEVDVAETTPAAPSESETTKPAMDSDQPVPGEQVYNTACKTCHGLGIVGAPKFGDKDSWAPRVAKGMEALVTNALQGFEGETGVMPAKGGQSQLSDDEVKAALTYMVDAVGANEEKEATSPETTAEETTTDDSATATEASAESTATSAETAPAETVSSTEPSAAPAMGEQVYKGACYVCHDAGVAGAPKFGDKDAWAPRVAKGMEALYTNALQGLGVMPPKGGRADFSDDRVKAAVDYMVSPVQ